MNDALIVHQAEKKLGSSSHLFLRHVRCDAQRGVLTLDGTVPSFYLKQTAQSLVEHVDGVNQIVNELVVVNPYGVSSEPMRQKPVASAGY
ncbi:BON domain protein [Pseudobythopirellula maris]|uniref:BON domain protein n=1 Tax=Pseudobythopirellula maris TaxID=2527991 RepID=A0A5C5ZSR4_9BACT|nr:BON domain-containing protein [Pseudobythopirellula maris]TWT90105.1 BON domain protein [Pseudobythopirellula maris]